MSFKFQPSNIYYKGGPLITEWQDNGIGGATRTNHMTGQTEYMQSVNNQRNRVMSPLALQEEIVLQDYATKNTPATIANNNIANNNIASVNQYDSYAKGLEGTGHVLKGISSLVNSGVGIWGAIEQAKLNKEQMANMAMQRKVWEEQISASREARTQRKQELARLNKMRSNTKAQFNTQATVTRSY